MALRNQKDAGKSLHIAEAYVCGFLCYIGIFAVGHLAGVLLHLSVTKCGYIIMGLLAAAAVCLVIGILMWLRKRQHTVTGRKGFWNVPMMVFLLLAAIQVFLICTGPVWQTAGDITLETVNSFLASDGIYTVSPLTGKPYSGPPFRYEILCLPTMYTLLCKWFSVTPEVMVNRVIPVFILFTAYAAYYVLGCTLFGQEKESADKRWWFLVIVAAVFLLCEGSVYMEGYGILYTGHLGTTWRNSILVPFTVSAVLKRKWWQAALSILAEICIVWTLWGLGVCLAVATGLVVADRVRMILECNRQVPPDLVKGETVDE